MLRGSLVSVHSNRYISENLNSPKYGEVFGPGLLLGSYVRKRGLLCPRSHGLQDRDPRVPQWNLAGTSPWGSRLLTGRLRPPHPQNRHGHSSPRRGEAHPPLWLPSSLLTSVLLPAYLPSRSQSYTSTLMVLQGKGPMVAWA